MPPEAPNQGWLDPLIERALVLLDKRQRHVPHAALVDDVAGKLLAEELPAAASLDVGIWGRRIFAGAAKTALRIHAVAVGGDDLRDEGGASYRSSENLLENSGLPTPGGTCVGFQNVI